MLFACTLCGGLIDFLFFMSGLDCKRPDLFLFLSLFPFGESRGVWWAGLVAVCVTLL